MKVWWLCLPLLALANLAYAPKEFWGWVFTLGFFLLVPGYFLLSTIKHSIKSRLEIATFSLGLSLLILMVSGLALNSLRVFGVAQPLTTKYIFITLDIVTLILLAFNKNKQFRPSPVKLLFPKVQVFVAFLLTLLPMLAISGAIRLNNGASNVLTMILFAMIAILFVLLAVKKSLEPLYPYAIFMIGVSALFATSLRGSYITGHDIQHEFRVFQATSQAGYWSIAGHNGDPYNACLSITILPTIIAKITSISAQYIFKVVFQIIFSFGLIPVYFFIKRLSNPTKALMGAFVLISFPAFLNDMPFLNRQEIAFVFFGLLMLTSFHHMASKAKTALVLLCLFGLILSHYSSGYVMLCLLLLAWIFNNVLSFKRGNSLKDLPILRLSIIFTALLFTFLWNSQITASTSNLTSTIKQTVSGLVDGSSKKDGFVQYSLLPSGASGQSPARALASYAGKDKSQVRYVPWVNLPITKLGKFVSHFDSVNNLNNSLHTLAAKIFQILLLLGATLVVLRRRKQMAKEQIYFSALILSCVVMLIVWTLVPQVSIDYTVIRLFQQTLVITALPIIIATEFLLGFLGRYKTYVAACFFAVLFLDLSGFVPQSLGGFLPQLSLNNSGQYYDFFSSHMGETVSSIWLADNRSKSTPVYMDTISSTSIFEYPISAGLINNNSSTGYLFQDYTNVHKGVYRINVAGLSEYSDPSITANRNLLYANQDSNIYGKGL
jgi:uncharacterized membrane protein